MTSSATKNSQHIAATESSSDTQNKIMKSPEAFYQGNNIAAVTGEDSFNDSGFFVECDEFFPPAPGSNYKDFPLYEYVGDELPEIDHDMDGFFADIHVAVHAKAISLYHQSNGSGIGFGDRNSTFQPFALGYEAQFSSSVEAIAGNCITFTVPQASKDGGLHSQSANLSASPVSQDAAAGSPLLTWAGTRHRHERIACLLSQQPQSGQDSKI